MLQSTGWQRVGHNWETEQQWRNTKTLSKPYHFLCDLTSYPMLFLNLPNIFLAWSEVAQSCPTLWTEAHQAPPSMGFSRQEYWSGLPFKKWKTKKPHLFRISRRQQFIPTYLCLPFKTCSNLTDLNPSLRTSNSKENLTTLLRVVQSLCACARWHSQFSHLWFFVTPWTVAHQAPLSMGFSRQEYWRGLHALLPDLGTELLCHLYWQILYHLSHSSKRIANNY